MMRVVKELMMGMLISGFVLIGLGSENAAAYNVIDNGNGGFLDIDYQVQAREAFSNIGGGPTGAAALTISIYGETASAFSAT